MVTETTDTSTNPDNKTFPFFTLMYFSNVYTALNPVVIYKGILSSLFFNPDLAIIVIVFLQNRYNGDSFKTIPQYNDAILPIPWYVAYIGFEVARTQENSESKFSG